MSTLNPLSPERRVPEALRKRAQIGLEKVDNISTSEYVDALLDQVRAKINQDTIYKVSNDENELSDRSIPLLKFNSLGSTTLSISLLDPSEVILETCTLRLTYGSSEENNEKIQYELFVSPYGSFLRDCSFSFYQNTASKKAGYLMFDIKGISSSIIPKISLNIFQYTSNIVRLNPVEFEKYTSNNQSVDNPLSGTELIYQIQCTDSSSTLTGDVDTRVSLPMYDLYGNLVENPTESHDFPTINGVPFIGSKKYLSTGKSLRNIEVPAKHSGLHKSQTGSHDWSSLQNVPISSHNYVDSRGIMSPTTSEVPGEYSEGYGLVRLTPFTIENTDLINYVKSLGEDTDVISVGAMKEFIRRYRSQTGNYILKSKTSHTVSRLDIKEAIRSEKGISVPLGLTWSKRKKLDEIKIKIQGVEINGSQVLSKILKSSQQVDSLVKVSEEDGGSIQLTPQLVNILDKDVDNSSIRVYYVTENTESNIMRSILINVEKKRSFPALMINGKVHKLTPKVNDSSDSEKGDVFLDKLSVNLPNTQSSTKLVVIPVIVDEWYNVIDNLPNSSIKFNSGDPKDWVKVFRSFTKDHFLQLICIPEASEYSQKDTESRIQNLEMSINHLGFDYKFLIEYIQSPELPKIVINGDSSSTSYVVNNIPSSGVVGYKLAVCASKGLEAQSSSTSIFQSVDLKEVSLPPNHSLPGEMRLYSLSVNMNRNDLVNTREEAISLRVNGVSRDIKFIQSGEVPNVYLESRPIGSDIPRIVIFPDDPEVEDRQKEIVIPVNSIGSLTCKVVENNDSDRRSIACSYFDPANPTESSEKYKTKSIIINAQPNTTERPIRKKITLIDNSTSFERTVEVIVPPFGSNHYVVDIRKEEKNNLSNPPKRLVAEVDYDSSEIDLTVYLKGRSTEGVSYRLEFDGVGKEWISNYKEFVDPSTGSTDGNTSRSTIKLKLKSSLKGDLVTKVKVIPLNSTWKEVEGYEDLSNFIYIVRKSSSNSSGYPIETFDPISIESLKKVEGYDLISNESQTHIISDYTPTNIISPNPTWNIITKSSFTINGNISVYPRAINYILGVRWSDYTGFVKSSLYSKSIIQLGVGTSKSDSQTKDNKVEYSLSRMSLVGYDSRDLPFAVKGGDKIALAPVGVLSVRETFKDTVVMKKYSDVICTESLTSEDVGITISDSNNTALEVGFDRDLGYPCITNLGNNSSSSIKRFTFSYKNKCKSTNNIEIITGTVFQSGIPTAPTWIPTEVVTSWGVVGNGIPSKGARVDLHGHVVLSECYLTISNSELSWRVTSVKKTVSLVDYPKDLLTISAKSIISNTNGEGEIKLGVDLDRMIIDVPDNFESSPRTIRLQVSPKPLNNFGVSLKSDQFTESIRELIQEKSVVSDLSYPSGNQVVISVNRNEVNVSTEVGRKMSSGILEIHKISKTRESSVQCKIVNLSSGNNKEVNDNLIKFLKFELKLVKVGAESGDSEIGTLNKVEESIVVGKISVEYPVLQLECVLPKGNCLPIELKFDLRFSSDNFDTYIDVPVTLKPLPNFFIVSGEKIRRTTLYDESDSQSGGKVSVTYLHNLSSPGHVELVGELNTSSAGSRYEFKSESPVVTTFNDYIEKLNSDIHIETPLTHKKNLWVPKPTGDTSLSTDSPSQIEFTVSPSYSEGLHYSGNDSSKVTLQVDQEVSTFILKLREDDNEDYVILEKNGDQGYSFQIKQVEYKITNGQNTTKKELKFNLISKHFKESVELLEKPCNATSTGSEDVAINVVGDFREEVKYTLIREENPSSWKYSPGIKRGGSSSDVLSLDEKYYYKVGTLKITATRDNEINVELKKDIPVYLPTTTVSLSDGFFQIEKADGTFTDRDIVELKITPVDLSNSLNSFGRSTTKLLTVVSADNTVANVSHSAVGGGDTKIDIAGNETYISNSSDSSTLNSKHAVAMFNGTNFTFYENPGFSHTDHDKQFKFDIKAGDVTILEVPICFPPSVLGYNLYGSATSGESSNMLPWSRRGNVNNQNSVNLEFDAAGGTKSIYVLTNYSERPIISQNKLGDSTIISSTIVAEEYKTGEKSNGKYYYKIPVAVKSTEIAEKKSEEITITVQGISKKVNITRKPADVKITVKSTNKTYEFRGNDNILEYYLDPMITKELTSGVVIQGSDTSDKIYESFHGHIDIGSRLIPEGTYGVFGPGQNNSSLSISQSSNESAGISYLLGDRVYVNATQFNSIGNEFFGSVGSIPITVDPSHFEDNSAFPKISFTSNVKITEITFTPAVGLPNYPTQTEVGFTVGRGGSNNKNSNNNTVQLSLNPNTEVTIFPYYLKSPAFGKPVVVNTDPSVVNSNGSDFLGSSNISNIRRSETTNLIIDDYFPILGELSAKYVDPNDGTDKTVKIATIRRSIPKLGVSLNFDNLFLPGINGYYTSKSNSIRSYYDLSSGIYLRFGHNDLSDAARYLPRIVIIGGDLVDNVDIEVGLTFNKTVSSSGVIGGKIVLKELSSDRKLQVFVGSGESGVAGSKKSGSYYLIGENSGNFKTRTYNCDKDKFNFKALDLIVTNITVKIINTGTMDLFEARTVFSNGSQVGEEIFRFQDDYQTVLRVFSGFDGIGKDSGDRYPLAGILKVGDLDISFTVRETGTTPSYMVKKKIPLHLIIPDLFGRYGKLK